MKNNLLHAGTISAITCVIMLLCYTDAHTAEVLPLMERPALISNEAQKSVLLDVVASGNRLIAVGERGHIMVSTDNGATWQQKTVPVSVTLTSVCFPSPLIGWAVGHSGIVLNTMDGGESWTKQLDGYQAADLFMAVVKAQRSTEGETESFREHLAEAEMLVTDGADKPFLDLCFTDQKHGFVVGAYNLIFHTDDGGRTWVPWMSHTQNPDNYHMYRMISKENDYYIVGELGLLMHSADRGNTFERVPSDYEGSYFGLIILKNGELIVYGLRGHAFRSTDRGATWIQIDTGTNASISDAVELESGTIVFVTFAGEVLVSHDRAHSFSHLALKEAFPFSAAAQACNGDVVLVGARGIKTVIVTRFNISADKTSGDPK